MTERDVDHIADGIDLPLRVGQRNDSSLVAPTVAILRPRLVASPGYVARHGAPTHPRELAKHNCLALYLGGKPQRQWTFWRDGAATTVKVQGNRRADDVFLACNRLRRLSWRLR